MRIKLTDEGLIIVSGETSEKYMARIGGNGKKYVVKESVSSNYFNASIGNSKTGPAVNVNFPIEYTCKHNCECYKEGLCYAEQGCYTFLSNQALYSENYNFYRNNTDETILKTFQLILDNSGLSLWRYFTCGDIPDIRFFDLMVRFAKRNPDKIFWAYTKKYSIVNTWIDNNGNLPDNLTIIFSHWLNNDGSYYPMENPHAIPVSEFIPFGREELTETVTHICPCSDPTVKATCATCDHPCYKLQKNQSMALLEHSTKATKERDKAIREAKKAL